MCDQIVGLVWCSSGIIFGSCCDSGLKLGQVKLVPFSLILEHFEAENHNRQVISLEPLELCHNRLIGVGYEVCSVDTCTSYTHHKFIYLFFILWVLFLSVVETLVIFSGGR